MINLLEHLCRHMYKIEKSIAGEGETTLVTQIQKLRMSNVDGFEKVNDSFREFAEKVVADSTQSLIDALTQVMRDFNTKINEQFGENFKRLNDAVGRVLEWQKEYAGRVEQMTEQFQRTLDGISHCEQVLTDLTKKAAVYQETSQKLDKLLDNLNTNLVAIDGMAKDAENAFPVIKKQIRDLTTNFASAVASAVRENNSMFETQKEAIDAQVTVLARSSQQLEEHQDKLLNELNGQIRALTEHFAHAVESAVRENNRMFESQKQAIDAQMTALARSYQHMEEHQDKLLNRMSGQIDGLMKENAARMAKQIEDLDKGLEEELRKALESLGGQLTSLSGKFVSDYTPLTEKLKALVNAVKYEN